MLFRTRRAELLLRRPTEATLRSRMNLLECDVGLW
jgi:hypothetical protein